MESSGSIRVKPMRKGTRSCTECRHRKIRCSFLVGSDICSSCIARGSACIDQRVAPCARSGASRNAAARQRQRRPVVSQNEQASQLQQHSQVILDHPPTYDASAGSPSDIELPVEALDHSKPPIVGVIEGSMDNITTGLLNSDISLISGSTAIGYVGNASLSDTKKARCSNICKTLRSALPGYDEIMMVLGEKGSWWDSFRQKTQAISQTSPIEPLLTFAARAYTSTNPSSVGTLAVAYARSSSVNHEVFALVDSLIISDLASVATVEGLECLVLLAKTYTDLGQPRRAWLVWRRGMAIAQMMGLYRVKDNSPTTYSRIWWAIYHGDRFTSLLLGLPSGFSDNFYGSALSRPMQHCTNRSAWFADFILRCAVLAGRVIDRNLNFHHASQENSSLYAQMEDVRKSAPIGWWDVTNGLPSQALELNLMVETLLVQFFFFHVQMYLHLPCLSTNISGTLTEDLDGQASVDAARQLLRRYLHLRSKVNSHYLFDCKTSDFVAFTASIVVILGSHGQRTTLSVEDWQLLTDIEVIFGALIHETGCKLTAQCHKTLDLLMRGISGQGLQEEMQEIRIPFFGNLFLRCSPLLSNSEAEHLATNGRQKEIIGVDYVTYGIAGGESNNFFENFLASGPDFGDVPFPWDGALDFDVDNELDSFSFILSNSL